MRVVVQRVQSASVIVNGGTPREIGQGLLCLFGAKVGDNAALADKLAHKVVNLRVFADAEGKLNCAAVELGYAILAVPNFTLYADTKKGLRPSFVQAASREEAAPLFARFVQALRAEAVSVQQGEFGADMQVSLVNDGPVTILLDTEEWET